MAVAQVDATHNALANGGYFDCNFRIETAQLLPKRYFGNEQDMMVMIKKLRTLVNETVLRRERNYPRQIGTRRVAGDVELFS